MEENTNNIPTQETTSDRNLRRRTRYAQMSPERKELLLSQLREKRAESKRQKNLPQSNSTAAVTITTSSLSPEQASKHTDVPSNLPTGEHIVTGLSTSELGMEEATNHVPTQERTPDTNLRRRTRYAQMSPKRKKLLLSQLREKRVESKRQKTLRQSNSTAGLTINTSSLSPEQASKPTNVPCTSTRGEHIVTCLSTFELGSTSTASHVASKLTSTRTANKGKVFRRGGLEIAEGNAEKGIHGGNLRTVGPFTVRR
ncbi:hypothetical protein AABB24_010370 [Solanum stoloniferum]|uniref:Uncharacterized protein n=1 Tax=Solanum stoloniferum TaxID=62892 RepID=A0ABD2UA63_9SOLN